MAILVSTPVNGVRVTKNATHITDSGGIAAGGLTFTLEDDTVLAQNDYAVIEGETVKVTDAADGNPRDITRSQNDHNGDATVATAHDENCYVRKQGGGYELLSYTFDNEDIAGFKVRSERAFWWALEVDGEIVSEGFCTSDVPFYPDVRPVETIVAATWKVLVWWQAPSSEARTGQMFWGEMFN